VKKLLLVALVASGLAFFAVQSSDAQISSGVRAVSFGFPGGYYAYYPTRYNYYPYGYYMHPYYPYSQLYPYYYTGRFSHLVS
jgi:hypothetical protein